MKEKIKKYALRGGALLLAVVVVVGLSTQFRGASLKATDEDETFTNVEVPAAQVATQEVVVEVPAPEPAAEPAAEAEQGETLETPAVEAPADADASEAPADETAGETDPAQQPVDPEGTDEADAAEEAEAAEEGEETEETEEEEKTFNGPHTGKNPAQLRADADGMSPVVATVPAETEVAVISYASSEWAQVNYEGTVGYIHRSQLLGAAFPAAEQKPNVKLTIFSSRKSVVTPGETITLTSVLEGAEGYVVSYQWECDKGAGFAPVPGATADSYSFSATAENLGWSWRLSVTGEKE